MYLDAAAFCGHWPYYRLRSEKLPQVLEMLKKSDISGGLMSGLEAVFYNDPWEADGPLLEALKGTAWQVAMAVNPMLPWAGELMLRGKNAGAAAVRLYPCVHDYDEDDCEVIRLCRLAGQLGLPVIVTLRMEDERMQYLLRQRSPDFARIRRLTEQCAGTKFLLSNCLTHQVEELLPLPSNVWFDTAGFKGEFYLEDQNVIPPDRILFGSFAPLQAPRSAVLGIPEASRICMMRDNLLAFLK